MDVSAMIHGLSSCGFFPSRAFLPAFLTALLLRFGNDVPWVRTWPIVALVPDAPTWFTHGITLTVLGLLALVEVLATKDDDAEEVLELVERYLKPAVAVLCFLGVLSVRDRRLIEEIGVPTQEAGLLDIVWIAGAGLLVNYLTALRADLRLVLRAADEDDDFGVRRALGWLEDVWALLGMLLVLLYPLVMLALLALVFGALYGIRRLLERREKQRMAPCAGCGTAIYPCALVCPACGRANARPLGVGFFGQSLRTPAPDLEALPLSLAEKRRCPRCATRLPARHPRQQCVACRHDAFGSEDFRGRYLGVMRRRLWPVLGVGFLFSLVPILGLIPGVLLVRHKLTSPFGRYLPTGRRFFTRWGLRLVFVALLSIHWIPGLGGIVVPIIGWLGYHLYRRAFVGLCRATAPVPATVPAPVSAPDATPQTG